MAQQELIQNILLREFGKAKSRNPSFSQRAFAKRLGLSSGAMSSLMNGKRRVSHQLAEKLLEKLGVNPTEKEAILTAQDPLKPVKRSKKELKLGLDQFEILANPIHFNLLALLEIEDYQQDITAMAEKLEKSKREIEGALARLKRLNLITEEEGLFHPTQAELAGPDEISDSSIKTHHLESMEEAKMSLYRDDITQRDFTSQTLAISLNKLPAAKKLIRNFGEQLAELLSTGDKEEVYKINIHFFPVSQLAQKNMEKNNEN